MEFGNYYGESRPEMYLDWVLCVERFFRWYRVIDARKLLL